MTISKSELKYILASGVFAFIWFVLALPVIIKLFDGNSPIFQFLIFNIGLYAFFFIFLKSKITNSEFNLKTSLGFLCLFLSLDTFMPEYHVTIQGQLIEGAALGVSTPDYIWGYLAQSIGLQTGGLTGFFIYLITYVIIPVALLMVSAKTISNFVRHI